MSVVKLIVIAIIFSVEQLGPKQNLPSGKLKMYLLNIVCRVYCFGARKFFLFFAFQQLGSQRNKSKVGNEYIVMVCILLHLNGRTV